MTAGGKQFFRHLGTDHAHHGVVVVVAVDDIAAGGGFLDVHLADIRGDTADVHIFEALLLGADFAGFSDLHADIFRHLQAIAQRLEVVPRDVAIAAHRFHELRRVANDAELVDEENVGTEVGDALGEVLVHAGDEGDYQNQSRDGEYDAQQYQEGPQFVGAHGLQRYKGRFAGKMRAAQCALLNYGSHERTAYRRRSQPYTRQSNVDKRTFSPCHAPASSLPFTVEGRPWDDGT